MQEKLKESLLVHLRTLGSPQTVSDLQSCFPGRSYGSIARSLRKLASDGLVMGNRVPGDAHCRKCWVIVLVTAQPGTIVFKSRAVGKSVPTALPVVHLAQLDIIPSIPGQEVFVTLDQAVEAVIKDFITAAKTFSAHDITNEVRDRVNTYKIRIDSLTNIVHIAGKPSQRIIHDEVKEVTHHLFNTGTFPTYEGASNGSFIMYGPIPPQAVQASPSASPTPVAQAGGSYNGGSTI